MDESAIEAQLLAYADGELSAEGVAEVEAYLADRPDARAYVETQRAIRAVVREKMPDSPAPAYLTQRVLDGIAQSGPGIVGTLREWWRTFQLGPAPSLALAAVAVIAVAAAFVTGTEHAASGVAEQDRPDIAMAVSVTGQIQCIDCAVSHRWDVNSECDEYGHRNGVITADGTMWTIKHSTQWASHVGDTSLWGKTVTLQAHRCGTANYLDVESLEIAGSPVAPSAFPVTLAASR